MDRKRRIQFYLVSIAAALILVALLGQANYAIDAFRVQVSIAFHDFGASEFYFSPFGVVRAQTHLSPLRLAVSLQSVDLEGLRGLIFSGMSQGEIYERLFHPAQEIAIYFALRILFLAGLGGGLGALIVGPRNSCSFLKGSASGLVVMLLLLALTFTTFSADGFMNPEYRGMLQAAPWMVPLIQEAIIGVDTLSAHVQVISANLYSLLQKVEDLGQTELERSDLKVLHVSDIHNNPVALELIEKIVNTFGVDLVIDTGDITDYGSPLEAELLSRLDDWAVPYLIALGNHDSPTIAQHLAAIPAVTLLQGEMVEIDGFTVMGVGDPAARRAEMAPADAGEMETAVIGLRKLLSADKKPDLLAVHEQRMAQPFVGQIPVILHGHSHSTSIKQIDGSVVVDAGTSGAAGIRGLQNAEEIPYTLVMLHFNRGEEGWRVAAADTISLYYREVGFEFRRTIFSVPEGGDEAGDDEDFPGS